MKRLIRSSSGDTIVEVLIAMAVASSVLGGAYVVVNRVLENSQQAQEHSEALQMAETQLERLKKYTEANPTTITYAPSQAYCFDASGNLVPMPSVHSLPQPENQYPLACKYNTGVPYRVAFLYKNNGTTGNTSDDLYTVYVDWPGATGGQDEVTLSYRVYVP